MTSSIFFLPAFVALLLLTTVSAMGKICPPANLCFVIDESGSITPTQFKQQADAINAIVDAFNGLAPGSSYSAVGFSTTSTPVSALTSDRALFKSRITANKQSGGNTSSGSGLNACSAILTPAKRPRVLVLITDGRDNTNPRGKDVAPGIKMKDISIATVGVGPGVSDQTLMDIASTPKLFTAVTNFAMLPKEINAIVATLCVDPTPSPSVTPTRSSTPTPSVTPTRSSTPTPSITPTRSSTPTPSVTPTRSASPTPSGTPTPSPSPMPRCANVDCARCGKVLECYVSSGSLKFDKWVCGAVVNKRVFCEKKKKTKCGQNCRGLKQGIKCFPGTKWPKCPAVIFAKGRAARCRGGGRKIKRGGGRGWDWDNDKHGKGGKHGKAGKRRFKRHVVETFASYRICMKGKKLKIKCKQWRCFKGKCRCFA